MTDAEIDSFIEAIGQSLGMLTDTPCPDCGEFTYLNGNGQRWCSKCDWEKMRPDLKALEDSAGQSGTVHYRKDTEVTIISDDKVIINTQGIRFVRCGESVFASGRNDYWLKVQYKGSELSVTYDTAEKRDAIFAKLKAALQPDKN